jgi:hypothetical protein
MITQWKETENKLWSSIFNKLNVKERDWKKIQLKKNPKNNLSQHAKPATLVMKSW